MKQISHKSILCLKIVVWQVPDPIIVVYETWVINPLGTFETAHMAAGAKQFVLHLITFLPI
jgi:hypothetical protein